MPDTRSLDDPIDAIAARASATDSHDGDLGPDIEALRAAGWLTACLPVKNGGNGWGSESAGAHAAFEALRKLGRANLSVARLYEGHVNAVKLIALHADGALREDAFERIRDGRLLGVWGADTRDAPVAFRESGGKLHLSGSKRFASGLGWVDHAIVVVNRDDGAHMVLVPVGDHARGDVSSWGVAGMRATRSGSYDFDGIALPASHRFGRAGAYMTEPHFEGGIWRYCAAHLGAAEAIHAELRTRLEDMGRAADPVQTKRLVEGVIALETMRLWILRAARAVEADGADPKAAALSLLAREVTEREALRVVALAEKALGMAAYNEGSTVERIARDLRLYLRQAAPDAKLLRAASMIEQRADAL